MNRREFSAQMLTAGAGLGLLGASGIARAQGGPIEGTHYVRLSQPVPFLANFENFQKIYYALEAMGQVDAMQRKVFAAVHVEHQRLDKPDQISALMSKNGIDGAKFIDIFNSFAIQTKVRQARQLTDAYKIDGVPAIGVQGRYYTSISLAGAPDKALAVTNFLIDKSRKGA